MRKTKGINTLFLKKSRKNKAFFVFYRGKSPSLSEDFDQFSDLGDGAFWFHLPDYQANVIWKIDGGVVILVIWSFVKIENGCGQNRHYNIKIYFYIIVSKRVFSKSKMTNDQMTILTTIHVLQGIMFFRVRRSKRRRVV